ncbi:hypothetical protein NLX67_07970 [Domibacillus sp. A3M-37]|nr:hypothetical protein [Domibacillus sp. A3M-37]MCP3762325.1 hypothetical protein [Domibacillus sp. A3M-37]
MPHSRDGLRPRGWPLGAGQRKAQGGRSGPADVRRTSEVALFATQL